MSLSVSLSPLRIGVVGAGNIGAPLARLWSQAGHAVKIANSRGPDSLTDVAQLTGATAATVAEAVKDANVVVVSIPQKNVAQLDKHTFSQLPADTIIIDTGNYYTFRDGSIPEMESGVESRWVEQQLGHPVIKAFNNIMANSLDKLGKPAGTAGRIAIPVAGDNAAHKATVIALIDQLGFDGVDAGGLDDSWRQQPGTPVYCTDWDKDGVRRALSRADRSQRPTVRDLQVKEMFAAFESKMPLETILAMRRKFMEEEYGE